MPTTIITYPAFKIVYTAGAFRVFYVRQTEGYAAIMITASTVLRTDVLLPEDVKDFELTVIPSPLSLLIVELDDAVALVPLGFTPPVPV
jgi:hypothetical protein